MIKYRNFSKMHRKMLDIRGKTKQGELIPDKISTNKTQIENGEI